jgi:plasmid stabilization system protein ParE
VKVLFSKRAEKGLEKIFSHVVKNFNHKQGQVVRDELVASILKLSKFPDLGSKIAGQADKRVLVVAGNLIIYEIVLSTEPLIVIRNIRTRRTDSTKT